MPKPSKHVFVCTQQRPPNHPRGSCASNHNAFDIFSEFNLQVEKRGLFNKIQITSTGCMGPCMKGTTVLVYPEGIMYANVKKDDVATIIDEHLLGDKPVEALKMPAMFWG